MNSMLAKISPVLLITLAGWIITADAFFQRLESDFRLRERRLLSSEITVWLDKGRESSKKRLSKCRATAGLSRLRGGSMPAGQVIKCAYAQEWDNQGVLFLLGTMPPLPNNAQPGTWFNPAQIGRARIHCSDQGYIGICGIAQPEVQLDPAVVIDREERPGCCYFPGGWVAIELPPRFQLLPHHYTLRNGGGTVVACMTGWVLEGSQSIDGPWQILDRRGAAKNVLPMAEHQCVVFNDLAQTTPRDQWPHHSVTFEVRPGHEVVICGERYDAPGHYGRGYRVFRLRQLQNRMPYSTNMYIQGIELYGDLFVPAAQP